jgi:hypothetical protein
MNGVLRVDSTSMRGRAKELRSTAEALRADHTSFAAQYQALIPRVGQDMFSPIVEAGMTAVHGMMTKAVTSNVKGLHDHASGLETMAATHDAAESANVKATMSTGD